MKEYIKNNEPIVRIQFGKNIPTYSMSFTDTTVKEVAEIAIKIFNNERVNIHINDVCPLTANSDILSVLVNVREERGSLKMKGSKSITLYGLTSFQAFDIFCTKWASYINK